MSLNAGEIRVTFGGVVAVDAVNFELEPHSALAVIGPNGSGKSTLLNAITGLVPRSGTVAVDGEDLRAESPRAARQAGVIRTFQTPQVVDELSCLDNVLLATDDRTATGVMSAWFGRRRMLQHERHRWVAANAALERFGLDQEALIEASRLTYGQRRWLELARAWIARPAYLLADEPSAGLNDAETTRLADYLAAFRNDGVGLVLVDHKVGFLREVADRALVLALGKVVATDDIVSIWELPAVQEAYLGAGRGI